MPDRIRNEFHKGSEILFEPSSSDTGFGVLDAVHDGT
jgi:hypothetical protein